MGTMQTEEDERQVIGFGGVVGRRSLHPLPRCGGQQVGCGGEATFAGQFDDFLYVQIIQQPVAGQEQGIERGHAGDRPDFDSHFRGPHDVRYEMSLVMVDRLLGGQ